MTPQESKQAMKLARRVLRGFTLAELGEGSLEDLRAKYGNRYSDEIIEAAHLEMFYAWAFLADTNAMKLLKCAVDG